MGEEKSTAAWMFPALIAGGVSLAGVWVGALLANREIEANQAAVTVNVEANKFIEVVNLRKEILASAEDYDFQIARLMLEHALRPIDEPESFDRFARDFNEYLATRVVEAPRPAGVAAEGAVPEQVLPEPSPGGIDYTNLVEQFSGSDRLTVSNFLIDAYGEEPTDVVSALIEGILMPSEQFSYRVNLYVVFTLARVPGGWTGTNEQLSKIEALRRSSNYRDPTFKKRTEEAINNFVAE